MVSKLENSMKKIALLMSFMALNASAGVAKLTVTFENYDLSKIKEGYVVFESSSPLCKRPVIGGAGPTMFGKSKSFQVPVKKINKNTVVVEASTVDSNNDICNYKFSRLGLETREIYWLALSTTNSPDYNGDDVLLDVLNNPNAAFEAVCRKTQCQKNVDGRAVGYPSNAMVFYADKKLIERNANINAKIKVLFQ